MVEEVPTGTRPKSSHDPIGHDRLPKMLVIGSRAEIETSPRPGDDDANLIFILYKHLTPQLIDQISPDIVVSNLIEADFDATDVARKLGEAAFAGKYRAISVSIPNPETIAGEIRAVAPDLDFELFQVNQDD